MIIKLTECRNSENFSVYVNAGAITYFSQSIKGKDTRIAFTHGGYLFVKEQPDEIVSKMNWEVRAAS